MLPLGSLSRRAAVIRLGGGGLAAALGVRQAAAVAAQGATPVANAAGGPVPAEITTIIEGPRYSFARWGIYVADRETGEAVYDLSGGERFLAASTTKLFPGAAALAAYGPDYRFETPVYRTGAVGADGTLAGDLILVASGDLTMGGRTTPDGDIAYTPFDHIYANVFPTLATLTPEDPLAGLDDLAKQVAAAGIRRVDGDVVIDARLFPAMEKDDYILTPIWINDNLIDITVTPGVAGSPATVAWRPQTAAYRGAVRRANGRRRSGAEPDRDLAVARRDRRHGADPGRPGAGPADLPGDGPAGIRPHPPDRGAGAGPAFRWPRPRPVPIRTASSHRQAATPRPTGSLCSPRRRSRRTSS